MCRDLRYIIVPSEQVRKGIWQMRGRHDRLFYEQRRDLIRRVSYGVTYCLVAFEGQDGQHFVMPLRTMGYDVGEYKHQYRKIRRKHRREKDLKSSAEYLSGFSKEDRLQPVVTIVLYYGEEPWEAATDLHGILDMDGLPEELKACINNYPLHIIDVRRMEHTDNFKTDLRDIFDFIKHADNMAEYMKKNKNRYDNLEEEASDMIRAITGIKDLFIPQKKKNNRVNLSDSLPKWLEKMVNEGEAKGEAKGGQVTLIKQAAKKKQKGKSVAQTAAELEESEALIARIYKAIEACPAGSSEQKIYEVFSKMVD